MIVNGRPVPHDNICFYTGLYITKVKPQTLSFTEPEGGAAFALFCFPLLLPDPCMLCNFSCPNSILSKSDSQLIDSSLPLSTFLSNNLQSFIWKAVEVESNSLQDFSIFFAISDIPVREVKKKYSYFSFKYPYNFIPVFILVFLPITVQFFIHQDISSLHILHSTLYFRNLWLLGLFDQEISSH